MRVLGKNSQSQRVPQDVEVIRLGGDARDRPTQKEEVLDQRLEHGPRPEQRLGETVLRSGKRKGTDSQSRNHTPWGRTKHIPSPKFWATKT
jgi:hypothetical protein